ncbi:MULTISPECIES: discoidin domain-containing protein [unclassified Microbacterium]|uniref:discoidin domain-containing protein n=1 Tax=Microbacterium TaxID=33882 RepID=UPI003B9FD70C
MKRSHAPGRTRALGAFVAATVGLSALVGPPAVAQETALPALPEITETTSAEGFLHPGTGVTADQLETVQEQVAAGVEPWASHHAAMAQTKYASKTYVGQNQGATDEQPKDASYNETRMRSRALDDSIGALTQAIMYATTGDEVYRANALHVLRTWSSLDPEGYAYFADAHIHTGVPLYYFVTAAEIIRSTEPVNDSLEGYDLRWTERDQQRAEENLVRPTLETFLFSQNRLWNQHTYGVVGMIAAAIFLDDPELYAQRVEWFSVNSTYESEHTINGGDVNGGLASLIRLIDADDPRNPYGEDFVELLEMARDQAHAEGDITTLSAAARMIHNQGTRLDPVEGTVSDEDDAVTPYGFLDNRLLEGADAFARFMMGDEPPFIDTSGGASTLSQAYRGRLRDLMNDLYYQYTYVEGVDVEEEAPYVALLHRQSDGPLYRYGAHVENFWNPRGSDFTDAEYWLAFPEELAEQDVQIPQPADTAWVPTAKYGLPLGAGAKIVTDDAGESFARLNAKRGDATVAVRRMVWGASMGIRVRTNGQATLQVSGTADGATPFEVSLPDTKGEWTHVGLDLGAVPPGTVGHHIVYLRAAEGAARVDVSGVLGDAKGELSPPVFADAPELAFLAVAGEPIQRALAVEDADSERTLSLQGAPRGATIGQDGALTWTPRAAGEESLIVVAQDGTSTATLPVRVTVAADRPGAIAAALDGLQDVAAYTSESWAAVAEAEAAAREGIEADSAGFAALLEDLRLAVADLDLLNPMLADGTHDYSLTATSPELPIATLRNLVDGSNQTTWGDRRDVSVELDFGVGYRIQADRIGFLARDTFPNRAEGTNAYGSNDNETWTLLTEHPNAGDDTAVEYVDVREEVRDERFRYLRLQIDEPGIPTDPAYPGIWSLADVRIDGVRSEATLEDLLDEAREADLSQFSRASALLFTRELEDVVAAASEPDADDAALAARLRAAWELLEAPSVETSAIAQDWVTASTPSWDGTRDAAGNGWAMFDGDLATYTDTTTSSGWVTAIPDDGSALPVAAVRFAPRAGHVARANGIQFQGSTDGGRTWTTFATVANAVDGWNRLDLEAPIETGAVRVLAASGNTNLAEVELVASTVDRSALRLLLDEAAELVEEGWTSESWDRLRAARVGAETVLADASAEQADVDAAADGLDDALQGLKAAR